MEIVTEPGNGLQGGDQTTEEMAGRIAAARISKWLEQLVLPGQDILVDAPHLAFRYPSLLKGDPSNVDTWNETAKFDTFDKLGLDHEKIKECRFKKDHWLSRPAWYWDKVSNCQEIKEVSEPWTRGAIDYVFCEDSSSFHEREDCKEFVAKLDSPYVRRFIRSFEEEGVDYQPRVRRSL